MSQTSRSEASKGKKANHEHATHHSKTKAKTFEEREQESSQLDNLFLVLREDLIEGHKEELKRKRHKRKANKNKQQKHKKGRRGHSGIALKEKAPKSTSLIQLSRVDSSDLTVDEQADLSLKRMANTMVAFEKRGEVKDALSVDSKALESSVSDSLEPEKARKRLGGADRAHDTALKNALREVEAEESLEKAENGDGPEIGRPEKYKPDGYSDHVAKRLVEEVVQEKRLKKLEGGVPYGASSVSAGGSPGSAASETKKGSAIKKLLEETDTEESLKNSEYDVVNMKNTGEDGAEESSFV